MDESDVVVHVLLVDFHHRYGPVVQLAVPPIMGSGSATDGGGAADFKAQRGRWADRGEKGEGRNEGDDQEGESVCVYVCVCERERERENME